MTSADSSYKGFRYPKEIISHSLWLYRRFALSRGHFQLRRHMLSASDWRREMTARFAVWNEITATSADS